MLALYLVTGWTIIGMSKAYAGNPSRVALVLMLGGGLICSCGASARVVRTSTREVAYHVSATFRRSIADLQQDSAAFFA